MEEDAQNKRLNHLDERVVELNNSISNLHINMDNLLNKQTKLRADMDEIVKSQNDLRTEIDESFREVEVHCEQVWTEQQNLRREIDKTAHERLLRRHQKDIAFEQRFQKRLDDAIQRERAIISLVQEFQQRRYEVSDFVQQLKILNK